MEGSVYLKARQEWDERYADLVLGKRNFGSRGHAGLALPKNRADAERRALRADDARRELQQVGA